ncbi:MAG: hypothetical protein Q7S40_05945, partial [Opitutaceae bacterium]|nr:hypothetical protein [Opitutaceae bacterium]
AGILPAGRLDEFRYSSYWYLRRPKQRPARLRMEAALSAVGDLPDRTAGWKCYADHLVWQAAEGPAGKNAAYVSLSRGWAIGGEQFKQALLQDHAVARSAEQRARLHSGGGKGSLAEIGALESRGGRAPESNDRRVKRLAGGAARHGQPFLRQQTRREPAQKPTWRSRQMA